MGICNVVIVRISDFFLNNIFYIHPQKCFSTRGGTVHKVHGSVHIMVLWSRCSVRYTLIIKKIN